MSEIIDTSGLFYKSPLVVKGALREHAQWQVDNSPLIQGCIAGSLLHAQAMHANFWHFVINFQTLPDLRTKELPRELLLDRFGKKKRDSVLLFVAQQLRLMKKEEGEHAALWKKDAERLGLSEEELGGEKYAGIRALVDVPRTVEELWKFFCILAGTEYIAEELSRALDGAPKFLALLEGKPLFQWLWGNAHLAVHPGPSHLLIDEDLARALHPGNNEETIRVELEEQTRLFHTMFFTAAYKIADDIERPSKVLVA